MSSQHPHPPHIIRYFAKNLGVVVGLVLVWRGIWYLLDSFDYLFLSGSHFWSGLIGVILGTIVLYFPDNDLKELEKL